ncbi:MAG: EamA family transporter [Tissierellaceae bacterium]|nr:EamA family transporter [Tissierellaceae bacterium]
MKRKDFILALMVVIVWGANFTVIKLGLDGVPSMLLVAMRYFFVAFPAVFFIKRPNIHWKYVLYYGFTVGVAQFGCLFYAMEIGMSAGLASIIVQLQAFLSPFLGSIFLKEKLKPKQLIGFFIAAIGLTFIGIASTSNGISAIPVGALLLTLGAPTFWSISNIIARYASDLAKENGDKLDMLSLVVWSGLVPPIPMIGLALLIDSPDVLINSIVNLRFISLFSALYIGLLATLFGYGYWNILLSKYPLAKISPLSLLVPITGLFTARIVLSESLSGMQWIGAFIILAGLIIANIDFKQLLNKSTEPN